MEDAEQKKLIPPSESTRITYKSKQKITLIILSIAMSSFYFGYCNVYFGQINIKVVLELLSFDMDPNLAKGLLNGAMPAGALFGAMGSSFLMRKLSRRHCLLLVNCIGIIVGGMLYIQNFYCFLICRICQGYVVGNYSVLTPLIIKQLAPVEISGTLGSYTQLALCSGVVFACFFSYVLKKITGDQTGKQFWFIIYGFTELTLIAQTLILLLVFPYETPKYLLSVGKQAQARELISIIYKEQFIDEIFEEKKADLQSKELIQAPINQVDSIISWEQISGRNLIKRSALPLIAALHLSALQQFSGVNAISIYAGDIATKSVSKQLSLLVPTLINSQQIVGGLITGLLLVKFGRKTLLQYGTFVAAVAHMIVGLGFFFKYTLAIDVAGQVFVLTGLVIFMAAYSFSLGPIIWLYIPQIIDARHIPSALVMHWVTFFIVVFLFPIITDNLLSQDPTLIFIFLGVYLFVSILVNARVMLETKGKSERQIREQYSQRKIC